MKQVYLSFGGNVGDVAQTFRKVISRIETVIGAIHSVSSLYRTAAWGKEDQDDFLNQVVCVHSTLEPRQIMKHCLAIETELGRVRHEKWGPRKIDIDVLFIDDEVLNEDILILPHPELEKRKFILTPMKEIAPDFVHPVLRKTITHLLADCDDDLDVEIVG